MRSSAWKDSLVSLKVRGLRAVELVVSNGHTGHRRHDRALGVAAQLLPQKRARPHAEKA